MKSLNLKNKWFQASLLLTLSFFALAGCGSRSTLNSGSADSSSSSSSGVSKASATCNQASSSDGAFTVSLEAYVDPNGTRNNSLVRMKFLKIPADYVTSGLDIHIVKWTASAAGVVSPADNQPRLYVNTRFDLRSNGVFTPASTWNYNLACSTCGTLEWVNMKQIASAQGRTYADATSFFGDYYLLLDLQDPNGDWKVLQVNFVTSANVTVHSMNILIPTFEANPADYQVGHPAILSNLHPFIGMLNQGWTTSQFQTQANGFCF